MNLVVKDRNVDWSLYPNFNEDEFRCKGLNCCGNIALMDSDFLAVLQSGRTILDMPFNVTSGYRCPAHNDKVSSTGPTGPHTTGAAVDIAISRKQAFYFLQWAIDREEISGIGIEQHGASRFIHLDSLYEPDYPRPALWSYS